MFLFDYFLYLWSFVFACLFILNGLKVNILTIIKYTLKIITMSIKSLKIKNKYYYDCDDIIIYDFDFDICLVKIFKRESKIGVNIYYIGYKPKIVDTITPLFFLLIVYLVL